MALTVAFLSHSASTSGAELYLERMLRATSAIAPVAVLFEDGPLRARLESSGVPVVLCPMPSGLGNVTASGGVRIRSLAAALPAFQRRLRAVVADSGAALAYSNTAKSHLVGVAALGRRLPVAVHLHERLSPDTYGPAQTLALRAAACGAALVVTSSETTRSTLTPRVRRRAVVHPCPVVLPPLAARPRAVSDDFSVALVGRVSAWKGQDLALDALAHLRRRAPGTAVSLHLYGAPTFRGDEEFLRRCRQRAHDLGVEDAVTWHGEVDDVTSAMRRHDVVVSASTRPEPFGQVVVEAMAAGVAVVVPDTGGPAEVVQHRRTGLHYAAGRAEALAVALDELRGDRQLRCLLASAGEARARDFALERLVPAWEEDLIRVAGARSR